MLGSMAIGLAASRFFKATGEQVARQSNASASHTSMGYDDYSSHISNASPTSGRGEVHTTAGRYVEDDRNVANQNDQMTREEV